MITKDEIEEKAKEFDIHTSNVQRDYIFGWILSGIYTVSELKNHLILKGGNCFRKAYFEKTRYSNDLDFSVTTYLSDEFVKEELNKVCDFIEDKIGVIFLKERNSVKQTASIDRDRTIHEARIYFKDFYGNESNITIRVRLDITQYDKIYLPTQTRKIIHPYSDINECQTDIVCVKLEELLASKLKCLLQRQQSGDLYDFVHSMMFSYFNIEISRADIASTLLRMTIFERNPAAVRGLLLDLPTKVFKSLWNEYLVCPIESRINFDTAISSFNSIIEELFIGETSWQDDAIFFSSKLRNPILEAGRTSTKLELVYDDVTRLVEPYSLSFKRKNNGSAREYFYGYDTTGGRRSGPGIKTFLSNKIQSIKNTNETFEPRFEVELSKSVESSSIGYFSKPFSSKRSQIFNRSSRPSGIKYVIQCPVCNKKFNRKIRSNKLNKHNDSYGNNCFGKTGFLVEIN